MLLKKGYSIVAGEVLPSRLAISVRRKAAHALRRARKNAEQQRRPRANTEGQKT
jgi:hypothetical protein